MLGEDGCMARLNLRSVAPLAYAPVLALEAYARRNVDRVTFELVKIRASQLNQCSYCIAMHTRDARKQGETEERIAALADDWRSTEAFDERERAALELTDALTRLPGGVSDDLHDQVVATWGEKGLAQLVMAIVAINTWNRVAIGTGMTAADLH